MLLVGKFHWTKKLNKEEEEEEDEGRGKKKTLWTIHKTTVLS